METQSISFNTDVIARSESDEVTKSLRSVAEAAPMIPRDCFAGARNDIIVDLGLSDYEKAHQKQLEIHSSVTLGKLDEVIIITEHYPVYTCGRTTKPTDRPNQDLVPLIDVERGGELTYHGPGQIVGYPILNLAKRRMSIPQYLRKLELALIEALQEIGIQAKYREEYRAGLWVSEQKLLSIGIAVRRWVTFHGFALNVDCDLEPFRLIKPCGLCGDQITSLKKLGCCVPKERVKECVVKKLIQNFF